MTNEEKTLLDKIDEKMESLLPKEDMTEDELIGRIGLFKMMAFDKIVVELKDKTMNMDRLGGIVVASVALINKYCEKLEEKKGVKYEE